MKYLADTPDAYLTSLVEDWRKKTLMAVRTIILNTDKAMEEIIEYHMLCYQLNNRSVFYLNVQQQYVSLYVGNIQKIDPDKTLLAEFSTGKGCIRVKRNQQIAHSRLADFIRKTIDYAVREKDTDC